MIINLPELDLFDYFINYSSSLNWNELNNAVLIDIDRNIIWLKYNWINDVIAVIESDIIWDKNFSIILWLDKRKENLPLLWKYDKWRNNELNSLMINKYEYKTRA